MRKQPSLLKSLEKNPHCPNVINKKTLTAQRALSLLKCYKENSLQSLDTVFENACSLIHSMECDF